MTAAEKHHPSDPIIAFSQLVHDLKNQLTILIACTDAVVRAVPRDVARPQLEALVKSAERATALTEEFLVGAMIGHARVDSRPAVDVNTVLRSTLPTLLRLAGDAIAVDLRLSPEPVPVSADTLEIERIVLNLVLNARDAMPAGGAIAIQTTFVPPLPGGPAGPKPPQVRLTVTDTGRGMTPEVKGRMFEPLFTTKLRGTGLGLNSVACTVRELAGTIAVESGVDRGTTVTVTLPIADNS